MREMQSSDRVGSQLVDVVRVEDEINENCQELKWHKAQMNARVYLVQQNWTACEAKHKVANCSHEPYIGLQIRHQTSMFGGLHLHLYFKEFD